MCRMALLFPGFGMLGHRVPLALSEEASRRARYTFIYLNTTCGNLFNIHVTPWLYLFIIGDPNISTAATAAEMMTTPTRLENPEEYTSKAEFFLLLWNFKPQK